MFRSRIGRLSTSLDSIVRSTVAVSRSSCGASAVTMMDSSAASSQLNVEALALVTVSEPQAAYTSEAFSRHCHRNRCPPRDQDRSRYSPACVGHPNAKRYSSRHLIVTVAWQQPSAPVVSSRAEIRVAACPLRKHICPGNKHSALQGCAKPYPRQDPGQRRGPGEDRHYE